MLSKILFTLTLMGLSLARPFGPRDTSTATANITTFDMGGPLTDVAASLSCPCNMNMSVFMTGSVAVIPNATINDVWDFVGDFYDLTWIGVNVSVTNGPDNFPGSLRSFSLDGAPLFTEQLDFVVSALSPQAFPGFNTSYGWPYYAQRFSATGPVEPTGLYGTNVTNLIAAYPTCNGTVLEWATVGCSNNTFLADEVFAEQHIYGLNITFNHFT